MDPAEEEHVVEAPADAAHRRVGTVLNSKWTLDSLLGVGGMGAVYAATHRNGSHAALKLLHAEFARERTVRERFLREGKIANRVDHPSRVAVTDDDVSDAGEPFLVMELLVGDTLSQLARRSGGRLPIEEALRIFDPVLELLAACHAVGIVHRDIKPANVFITKDHEVKVLDFGVARMREAGSTVDATRAGTALGTPAFMAPEQALGHENLDGRADLWSVGACIFSAITGKRLHAGGNDTESYLLAATQAAPSIATVDPELPVEVVAFVDRALAFDRNRRFADAAAMRGEMLAILAALRAGHLKSGAAKKEVGLVVRGEQIGDDDEAPPTKEAKEEARERIAAIWKNLGIALTGVRQYGFSHPLTSRALQVAFEDIVSGLSWSARAMRWEVTASAFTYDGVPVWTPDRSPFDRIPWQLFADGVRKIQLKQGITEQELRDLVAILLRDPDMAGAEDDSVTALWDRRFDHIAYFAIDSFAEGDESQREDFQRETALVATSAAKLAQIEKGWDEGSLEARAMQANIVAALKEAGEAAAALAVDALTRATLGAQLVQSTDLWTERYVDAFVDAYKEGVKGEDLQLLTDALTEWTHDQIALHSYSAAFAMCDSLCRAFAAVAEAKIARGLERKMCEVMFPIDTVRAILSDLTKEGAREIDGSVAQGIQRALSVLGNDSAFGLALDCLEASEDERLRAVLLSYVRVWATGHEAQIGAVLARARPKIAMLCVRVLAGMGTTEATTALERAFESKEVEVRIEALKNMPDAPAERIRDELGRLLDGKDANVRAQTLRVVAEVGLLGAGPVLSMRIQDEKFHALPLAERTQWFEAVEQLNPRRAEGLAIDLLGRKQILNTKSVEETRVLAAQVLARVGAIEGVKAAQEAASSKWMNSQTLRDAAKKAADAITARLGAVDPGRKSRA